MSALRPAVARYLAACCPGASASPIQGDASTRRFYRVSGSGGPTRVLMDYGRPFQGEPDDVALTRVFFAAGLRVPEIVDVAPEPGCLLLEDLGSLRLEAALRRRGSAARELLERAVQLAADVAGKGTEELARSARSAGPALGAERFRFEMDFFLEHYARDHLGRRQLPDALADALHELAGRAAETPRRVLCHRDFHSRNLMVLDDGGLAMVDVQDARWGPDGYDLASLLYDAYVDAVDEWRDQLVDRYVLLVGADAEEFRRRLERIAAQRMIKALGTFGFQARQRGNRRYLEGVPRTLVRLRGVLRGSALLALLERARLFDPGP